MGSIFDILGPVMVGPSSSHTAGAARIGLIARQLFGRQPKKATVYLHGSFAATGKGHGTDRALIAGLLGMKPDDMRIPNSFEIAREEGMEFTIENKDIKEAHPNTAQIIMEAEGVNTMKIQAYSIGGGRIKEVASALSNAEINIATMQVFRDKRGGFAVMVVETDQVVPKEAIDDLESKQGIIRVKFLNANGETE